MEKYHQITKELHKIFLKTENFEVSSARKAANLALS